MMGTSCVIKNVLSNSVFHYQIPILCSLTPVPTQTIPLVCASFRAGWVWGSELLEMTQMLSPGSTFYYCSNVRISRFWRELHGRPCYNHFSPRPAGPPSLAAFKPWCLYYLSHLSETTSLFHLPLPTMSLIQFISQRPEFCLQSRSCSGPLLHVPLPQSGLSPLLSCPNDCVSLQPDLLLSLLFPFNPVFTEEPESTF